MWFVVLIGFEIWSVFEVEFNNAFAFFDRLELELNKIKLY